MRNFSDNLDDKNEVEKNKKHSELNQYNTLADKWNTIHNEYIDSFPELEMDDLYYETGGFKGALEKIAEIRGRSVEEIRTEIENW